MDLGLLGAFVGGALTILSPCSVMLLPAFFSYAFTSPGALVGRTGLFYLGLATTLVPLGILAGSLGAWVNEHRNDLVTGAAVLVIALGVVMALDLPVPTIARRATRGAGSATAAASVYALGTVYGLAGVCAGPLLGTVLTMAAVGGSPWRGGVTLLVFAAGMTAPLLLLALAWDRVPAIRRLVRPRVVRVGPVTTTLTNLVGGLLSITVGVVLLRTEGTATVASVLTTEQQHRIETWVLGTLGPVPNLVLVPVAAAVALWAWRRRGGSSRPASDHRSDASPAGVEGLSTVTGLPSEGG